VLCLCCVKCTFPAKVCSRSQLQIRVCVRWGGESVRACVCVFFFLCMWMLVYGHRVLMGLVNLCVVFLLLWERNVSLHVHALMDSCSVNLLWYVELQKFGAVFSSLFWWFWDFVRWFQRWSFKIPYCCSDRRLIQYVMRLLITSLVSWIDVCSHSKQQHVSRQEHRNRRYRTADFNKQ